MFGGEDIDHPMATADACILLWMGGGMAAPDTFDPKHYTPYREGLPVNEMVSTFPAIDTSVNGLKITEGMEEIASVIRFLISDESSFMTGQSVVASGGRVMLPG